MIDIFWEAANILYKKINRIARIMECMSMCVSSHAVSAQISVDEGTCFYHHSLGCTFLQSVKIGKNCKIFPNVTIGNAFSSNSRITDSGGKILIGDNCIIGTGAKILGHVNIGNNVNIGANAVVLKDVPDNCTVVGVPAKIKKRKLESLK